MMAGERAPLNPLTPDEIGVAVIIVCYSLTSVSVMVTIIRYSLSAVRKVGFGLDDAAYVLANVRISSTSEYKRLTPISPGICHRQHDTLASSRQGRTRTAYGRSLSG
jgi:hypothetical protein